MGYCYSANQPAEQSDVRVVSVGSRLVLFVQVFSVKHLTDLGSRYVRREGFQDGTRRTRRTYDFACSTFPPMADIKVMQRDWMIEVGSCWFQHTEGSKHARGRFDFIHFQLVGVRNSPLGGPQLSRPQYCSCECQKSHWAPHKLHDSFVVFCIFDSRTLCTPSSNWSS